MLKYRPEIDGLRALAVVPVILFHAGFEIFNGGYLGVDIFFVISGYLITSILAQELDTDRFSYKNFIIRRSRRILPALFFVMLLCIPISFLVLDPEQMKVFARSLVSVNLLVSNIFFWLNTGYFDTAADEHPLLHTWSLSVEEQFYLFFPIFLLSFWRFGKNRVFWLVAIFACASLLTSEWGSLYAPSANFYFAPTRAWELLSGSLVALWLQAKEPRKNNFLASAGAIIVLASLLLFDENTPMPSAFGLIPIAGVLLIIVYGRSGTYVGSMLSIKPIVFVGTISYSAYLIHQPLFSYASIIQFSNPSRFVLAVLIAVTFVLASLSYKYIETPFRKKMVFSQKFILSFSITGMIFFLSCGAFLNFTSEDRLRNLQDRVQKNVFSSGFIRDRYMFVSATEEDNAYQFSSCLTVSEDNLKNIEQNNCAHQKIILLIGDSHARDIYQMLGRSEVPLKDGIFVVSAHNGGCRIADPSKPRCVEHYKKLNNALNKLRRKIDTIIYIQSPKNLLDGDILDNHRAEDLFVELSNLSSIASEVIFLGPRADIGLDRKEVIDYCFHDYPGKKSEVINKFYEERRKGKDVDLYLQEISTNYPKVRYESQVDILGISQFTDVTNCINLFFSDRNHLSKFGEKRFGHRLAKFINALEVKQNAQ